MSYRILFKGNLQEIEVSDDRGRVLAQSLENGTLEGMVNIDGSLYDSKSIKAVVQGRADAERTQEKIDNMREIQDMENSFQREKRRVLGLSPKERAKRLNIANLLARGIMQRELSEKEQSEIIDLQEKYFEQHPNHAEANPTVYKHILERGAVREQKSKAAQHISDGLRTSAITIALKQFSNAIDV